MPYPTYALENAIKLSPEDAATISKALGAAADAIAIQSTGSAASHEAGEDTGEDAPEERAD